MKKKNIVYLLIWFLSGMPLLAQGGEKAAKSLQEKEQWQFGSFGKDAKGKADIGIKKMTLWTQNTRNCFFESDQYSFVFLEQPFPYDDCSRSTVSVVVDQFTMGSAGIMMRSGNHLDAANVHLEVQATGGLFLFSRKTDGVSTAYKRIGIVSFPVEIKLLRQGDMFIGYYKDTSGEWVKGASTIAEVGTEPLVGFYACSGNDSQIGYDIDSERKMDVTFRNWTVNYEENYVPAEKDFVDRTPVKKGTLLRDNFADGSMSNKPASNINPIWEGIKHAELPRDKDGKRYWRKRGDGIYFLGDKKWADYEVNIDLAFDKNSVSTSEFMLQIRYQNIAVYDKMLKYYGVSLREGNKLVFEKFEPNGTTISKSVTVPTYFDGAKHQLRVIMLDKKYSVYFDGKLLIDGSDDARPITYGNIALKFTDVSMNVYQIEVLEVDDPINGSADNYLLDYYDTPLPAYLKKYGYTNNQ